MCCFNLMKLCLGRASVVKGMDFAIVLAGKNMAFARDGTFLIID